MNQNIIERKPLLLRGPEVAEALGISRALAYRWMQTGVLPTVRVSRSVRVPHEGLLHWIRQNTHNVVSA
jgi:excisionase family DNA binding protein